MKFFWWFLVIFFSISLLGSLVPPYQTYQIIYTPVIAILIYYFYRRATRDKNPKNNGISNQNILKLYRLALEVLADGIVEQSESERLQNWFFKNPDWVNDYRVRPLGNLLNDVLEDNFLDSDEANEVFTTLSEFCNHLEEVDPNLAKDKHDDLSYQFDAEEGEKLRLVYEDAQGNISERDIVFKASSKNNGTSYMKAYCLKRKAMRTFRVDRIKSLLNLESGELWDLEQ